MLTALFLIIAFSFLLLLYSAGGDRSVCYDELGCFETGSPFYHALYRPISVLPQDPLKISMSYNLYTRKNPIRELVIKPKDDRSLKKSNFNPNRPTKFITHGFRDGTKSHWMKTMKTALLSTEDVNVITIDWSVGAVPPYSQASSNTRVVGAEIARFIKELEDKYGLQRSKVHLIGHSLGAHVCGYAGERFNGTLARITALDAAEPYFQNLPENVRLDPGDAQFVDVIHTDGRSIALLGFGMIQPVGHVDFYPDSGHSLKSCDVPNHISAMAREGILEGIFSATACNHRRAQDLFTESITTQCPFVGHACTDYEAYEMGECASCGENNTDCARLGYHSDTYTDKSAYNKKFYLTTNHHPPAFCMYHYVVTVRISEFDDQNKETGLLYANLHGEHLILPAVALTPESITFEPGATYQFLVPSDKNLGEVDSLDIFWENKLQMNPNTWMAGLNIRQSKLYIDSIIVEPIDILPEISRQDYVKHTCSVEGRNTPIVPGVEAMFSSIACEAQDGNPVTENTETNSEDSESDNVLPANGEDSENKPTNEQNMEEIEQQIAESENQKEKEKEMKEEESENDVIAENDIAEANAEKEENSNDLKNDIIVMT